MPAKKVMDGTAVTIRCAHGDTVLYPVAKVTMEIGGEKVVVEAAVSKTLPASVLLRTDIPVLTKLLGNEPNKLPEPAEEAFVIHTRAQTRRLQVEERRRLQKEQESGAQPHPIDDNAPSREKESDHKVERNEEEVEARSEDTRIAGEEEGDNPETEEEVMISNEFEEDLFSRSKERTKQTRSQKRAARQLHFTEIPLSKHPMDISTEEFHQLQEVDGTLEGIHRAAEGHVSTAGAGFFKRGEVIYRRWTPPGKEEGETSIDQPRPCRQTVLQVAHSIPLAEHMGRDKTTPAVTLLLANLVQGCG